jgi:hypothetical protein
MRAAVSCPSRMAFPLVFLDLDQQEVLLFLECDFEYFDSVDEIFADDSIGSEFCLEAGYPGGEDFLLVFPLALSHAGLRVFLLSAAGATSRKLMTETQFTFSS